MMWVCRRIVSNKLDCKVELYVEREDDEDGGFFMYVNEKQARPLILHRYVTQLCSFKGDEQHTIAGTSKTIVESLREYFGPGNNPEDEWADVSRFELYTVYDK